ncbi:MAG TPA: hypothetical protein VIL00_00250 [Pseudonocardiaceae bacterium]
MAPSHCSTQVVDVMESLVDVRDGGWIVGRARHELDELIGAVDLALRQARDLAVAAARADFGPTRAGRETQAVFARCCSDAEGGLVWFWRHYRDSLAQFRDQVVTAARRIGSDEGPAPSEGSRRA